MTFDKLLKRDNSVEVYRELEKQVDNQFTLLEILEISLVETSCCVEEYFFTLDTSREFLKCWNLESAILFNSIRFPTIVRRIDRCEISATDKLLLLNVTTNSKSLIYTWQYKNKSSKYLKTEPVVPGAQQVKHCLVSYDYLILCSEKAVTVYNIEDDCSIKYIAQYCEPATAVKVSCVGELYIAFSKTLTTVDIWDKKQTITPIDAMDKIIAMFEMTVSEGMSLIITCHFNHVVRIWKRNSILGTVNLLSKSLSSETRAVHGLLSSSVQYNMHYAANNKEKALIISHNDNITIFDPWNLRSREKPRQVLRAHRSDIIAIKTYPDNPWQVISQSVSEVRLWRYSADQPHDLLLVGEIVVSNASAMVPVPGVGLYLSGECYEVGLVLWRQSRKFLSDKMLALREERNDQETS